MKKVILTMVVGLLFALTSHAQEKKENKKGISVQVVDLTKTKSKSIKTYRFNTMEKPKGVKPNEKVLNQIMSTVKSVTSTKNKNKNKDKNTTSSKTANLNSSVNNKD
ncbi:MAG: hypothetical protein HRT68_13625 [Flavobacteriaceae bacterium]|nr:hypothetical protein [Flavobacteriaceae bacterium]